MAEEFGSRLSAILASTRGPPADARARAISMAVYRLLSPRQPNLTVLGRVFDRDRTSVRHALARVEGWRAGEPGFEKRFAAVVRRVRNRQA